jgi:hypothetical protein
VVVGLNFQFGDMVIVEQGIDFAHPVQMIHLFLSQHPVQLVAVNHFSGIPDDAADPEIRKTAHRTQQHQDDAETQGDLPADGQVFPIHI